MSRVTPKDLRDHVEYWNLKLETNGADIRFKEQGRNGYQAVDEYELSKRQDGDTCSRNVGCGTSREVIEYVTQRGYQILNQLKDEKIKALERKLAE